MTRSLRRDYEYKLASNRNVNVKQFWKYVNSRLKTRLSINFCIEATRFNSMNLMNLKGKLHQSKDWFSVVPEQYNRHEQKYIYNTTIKYTINRCKQETNIQ